MSQGRLPPALLRPPRHPSGEGLLRLHPRRARGLTSPHWGPGCGVLPGLSWGPCPRTRKPWGWPGCAPERNLLTCACSVQHPLANPARGLLSLIHPLSCWKVCLLHLFRARGQRGARGTQGPAKAVLPSSSACRTHQMGPQVTPQHPGLLSEAGQPRRGGTEPQAWRPARPGPAPAGLHRRVCLAGQCWTVKGWTRQTLQVPAQQEAPEAPQILNRIITQPPVRGASGNHPVGLRSRTCSEPRGRGRVLGFCGGGSSPLRPGPQQLRHELKFCAFTPSPTFWHKTGQGRPTGPDARATAPAWPAHAPPRETWSGVHAQRRPLGLNICLLLRPTCWILSSCSS